MVKSNKQKAKQNISEKKSTSEKKVVTEKKSSSKLKQKVSKILKNKPVAIFLTVTLLILFTLFVMNMVGNINGKMATQIKLETNQGDIIIQLYDDMPITTNNFKDLVDTKTYDGVIFHRVIDNFMIQGGDPTGTGMGDPSISNIKDEFVPGHSNVRGTISMANTGVPNSGSSQFFINLVDNSRLDYDKYPSSSKHPVFGEVVEGMDIVDKIAKVQVGQGYKPIKEVKIIKATLI